MKSTSINFYLLTLVLLVAAALFAIGLYRIEIDTDIVSSLPQNDPVISDGLYIIKNHPIQDHLIIDISHQKDDLDILIECAELVEERLKRSGLFKSVGMKDAQNLIPDLLFYILSHLPVMFSESELKTKIEPLLNENKIQKKLTDIRNQLLNIESIGQAELILKDPLGLTELVMAKLAYLSPSQNVRIYKRQLISSDGKHLLLMANPITSSTETSFARQATELIHTLSLEVEQKYSDSGYRFTLTPVGAYRVALDNELIVRKDVRNAILFAMIGIILLLIFAFPRPLIGLLSLLPAIAGTMIAFFVYSLLHKTVSLMVLGFGGAIISISVDHAIAYLLFLDRPHATYGREASREIRAVGLLAVLTTAGAFTALNMSGFPILKQLGQFTALGISFSFIFVHTIFPLIFPEMPPARPRALALQNMVNRFALTGKTGAICALIFAIFMIFFAKPKFNVSLSSMNTVSSETAAAENLVSNVWGKLSNKIYVMTEGKSIIELQKKGDRLLGILDQEIHPEILSPGFVPSMIFPGADRRRQNFSAWQHFWNRGRVSALNKSIKAASVDLGFTADAFDPFYQILKPDSYLPINLDIPEKFFNLFGIVPSAKADTWIHVSTLTMGPSYNSEDFFAKYRSMGKLFDPAFFSEKLGKLLFSTFLKMLIIVGASVTVLLFIFFFDVTLTFISLLPVLFALVSTLGTLKIIGKPLDIPGLMLAIIVMGMGIDYSLFFVRSYQRYGNASHSSFGLIRMAVFMASASTLIGFGVLSFAEHSLLKSAGITSLLGIGYSLIGAFIILPPVLNYRFRIRRKNDTDPANYRERVLRRYRNMEAYPRLFVRFKLRFDPMFSELPQILKSYDRISTIIDIGCGYGLPANWLLEQFPDAKIYGIDPDRRRVRIAAIAVGEKGSISPGRAPYIPTVPERVDLVIMLDIIQYLNDDELKITLDRLGKKLHRSSHLVIRAPISPKRRFPLVWWLENFKLKLSGTRSYYRSIEKNKTILMKAGFNIERTEPSGSNGELVWFTAKVGP